MKKNKFKKVLVVLGGTSGERSVSLNSGKSCVKALKKRKYLVSTFDPKFKNLNLISKQKIDVIFNDGMRPIDEQAAGEIIKEISDDRFVKREKE